MVQREIGPLPEQSKAIEYDYEGNGIKPMTPKEGLGASRNASGFFFVNKPLGKLESRDLETICRRVVGRLGGLAPIDHFSNPRGYFRIKLNSISRPTVFSEGK
jgi:hypothetical protein